MAWKHSSGSNGAANTLLILTTTWIASERRGEAERRGAGLKLLTTSQKLVRVCRPTPDAHSRLASGPLPFRFYPLRTGSEERSKFPQVPQPQMCRNGVWNAGPSPKGHVIFRMWYCSSPEERDIREGKRKVDLMHLSCSKKKKKKKSATYRKQSSMDHSLELKHSSEYNRGRFYSSTCNYKEIKATVTRSFIGSSK